MGFSHPRLVKKLKGRNHCYVDCTFASTPRPFVQTLNFMMFDDETQSYVCVFWVLLTGQFEKLYAETLHQIWIATDRKLNPLSLTLDYELMQALLSSFKLLHHTLIEEARQRLMDAYSTGSRPSEGG